MKNIILITILALTIGHVKAKDKIAVIDSGVSVNQILGNIMCAGGIKTLLGTSGIDRHGHGTNIIGLITDRINTKKYCIISYRVWRKGLKDKKVTSLIVKAINMSIKDKVVAINISMGGGGFNKNELLAIKKANKLGIYVIVAAGNESANLNKKCDYYPACYRENYKHPKFRVVTTYSLKSSNRGKIVTDSACGYKMKGGGITLSGTSQATALITSKIIRNVKKRGIIK